MKPKIKWTTSLGSIQSRNNILIVGDKAFVSTSGRVWDKADEKDAVHCLNARTGETLWTTHTASDVNEITAFKDTIIAPTDRGTVFFLNKDSGSILGSVEAGSKCIAKPMIFDAGHEHRVLLFTLNGDVIEATLFGEIIEFHEVLEAGVRANAVNFSSESSLTDFLVFDEAGAVTKLSYLNGKLLLHPIADLSSLDFTGSNESFPSFKCVHSHPIWSKDQLIGGVVLDTFGYTPPLYSLCPQERTAVIFGSSMKEHVGNLRTPPLIVGNKLFAAFAYTVGVTAFELHTGKFLDTIRLGQTVFQQWSAPVKLGSDHVVIGRVDGVLSIIDTRDLSLVSSLSLATPENEKRRMANRGEAYTADNYSLYPGDPPLGGICGTPTVVGSDVYVGTTEGEVYCINFQR